MNHNLFLLAAAGMFLAAPVIGLESPNFQSPVVQPQGQMVGQHGQQVQVSDDDLSDQVEKAISSDKKLYDAIDDFDVEVNNGVVTIEGEVESPALKSQVESIVRSLPGVKQVINNIEVEVEDSGQQSQHMHGQQ